MSSEFTQDFITVSSGKHRGDRSTPNNMREEVGVRKRRAGDDGETPGKRMRWSNFTKSTERCEVSVEDRSIQSSKRKAGDDGEAPKKKSRCSIINNNNNTASVVTCSGKRKADHDGDSPKKRSKPTTEASLKVVEDLQVGVKKRKASDDGEAPEKKIKCSTGVKVTGTSAENVTSDDDGVDVSQNFSCVSAEEEKIFELSSTANRSRGETK